MKLIDVEREELKSAMSPEIGNARAPRLVMDAIHGSYRIATEI